MKIKIFFVVVTFAIFFISCTSSEGPEGTNNIGVSQQSIVIQLDKTSFEFSAVTGQSDPPSQSFQIRNSGSGELQYQISTNRNWLTVSPSNGSSTGEWDLIKVSVKCQGMTAGNYSGEVNISCGEAMNSPQSVSVSLELTKSKTSIPEEWTADTDFGGFDFIVNPNGDAITKITLKFSNWKGRSGSISVSDPSGWAISNRKFEIKIDLSDPLDPQDKEIWTFNGTFSVSGDQASGTWKAVINGSTYSGSWKAFPKS